MSAKQAQGRWLQEQYDIWSALQGGDRQSEGASSRRGLVSAHSPRKPDLHEGAVEKRPLGDDKVGAEAAGNDLLRSSQLLLGKL